MERFRELIGAVSCLAAVLAALCFVTGAHAQAPDLIAYQGKFADVSSNAPVPDGSRDMVFRFYDAETGGGLLLTDRHTSVDGNAIISKDGIYQAFLGGGTNQPGLESSLSGVFRNRANVWMSVQVCTPYPSTCDSEMNPRQRIVSSAYALQAEELAGQGPAHYLDRANHTGTQASSTVSPQGAGSGLDADTVDAYHAGNGPNQVPVSNGTLNTNLNADLLDGATKTDLQERFNSQAFTASNACGSGTDSASFRVPSGVTSLLVLGSGGGGGGGGGGANRGGGGGGGGGSVPQLHGVRVAPGQCIPVVTGRGGCGGPQDSPAQPGGTSMFGPFLDGDGNPKSLVFDAGTPGGFGSSGGGAPGGGASGGFTSRMTLLSSGGLGGGGGADPCIGAIGQGSAQSPGGAGGPCPGGGSGGGGGGGGASFGPGGAGGEGGSGVNGLPGSSGTYGAGGGGGGGGGNNPGLGGGAGGGGGQGRIVVFWVSAGGLEDGDGDGVANAIDNCPTMNNPGQYDADADCIGDVCE